MKLHGIKTIKTIQIYLQCILLFPWPIIDSGQFLEPSNPYKQKAGRLLLLACTTDMLLIDLTITAPCKALQSPRNPAKRAVIE